MGWRGGEATSVATSECARLLRPIDVRLGDKHVHHAQELVALGSQRAQHEHHVPLEQHARVERPEEGGELASEPHAHQLRLWQLVGRRAKRVAKVDADDAAARLLHHEVLVHM